MNSHKMIVVSWDANNKLVETTYLITVGDVLLDTACKDRAVVTSIEKTKYGVVFNFDLGGQLEAAWLDPRLANGEFLHFPKKVA